MSVRVGVVGLRFGRQIHIPAFRSDPRCEVIALAGRDADAAARVARDLGVPASFADWRDLVAAPHIDAVGIAVPPAAQPAIVSEAVRHGKHVFCEKPLAASVGDARQALSSVEAAGVVHGIDFIFPEIAAWQQAQGAARAGRNRPPSALRVHLAGRNLRESHECRDVEEPPDEGGGVLGNFVSHVFHNIEWLFGGIRGSLEAFRGARATADGAARSMAWSTGERTSAGTFRCAPMRSWAAGTRIEIYGDEGTLMLHNPTARLRRRIPPDLGSRASGRLTSVFAGWRDGSQVDGRLAPVSELVRRFVDAIHAGGVR